LQPVRYREGELAVGSRHITCRSLAKLLFPTAAV
jgi:hypothetical protein